MFNSLLIGAIWSIGLSWTSRLIGLCSIIIVARILTPEDYGIVAIAMIVMHFVQNLSSAGTSQYLIQKSDLDAMDVRTAWTLAIIFRLLACIGLFLSSDWLADYFEEPRLVTVFHVLAFLPLLEAFQNYNIFIAEKNIQYKPIFLVGLTRKITSFATALTLALHDFSYWSLIYAEVAACCAHVLSSYLFLDINTHYTKPSLARWRQQLDFTRWSYLQVFIGFTRSKLDGIFTSKYAGTVSMGEYHLSSSLAEIPSNEFANSISRPIYSGMSKYDRDSLSQIALFYKSIATLCLSSFFLSFLLATLSHEIVLLLLGDKWHSIPVFVSILSVSYALYASGTIFSKLLLAQGKAKLVFQLDLVCFVIVLGIIGFSAVTYQTLLAICIARFVAALITLFISAVFAAKATSARFSDICKAMIPTFVICTIASLATLQLAPSMDTNIFLCLALKAILYCAIFVAGLYVWSIICRYRNLELFFISRLKEVAVRKLKGKKHV